MIFIREWFHIEEKEESKHHFYEGTLFKPTSWLPYSELPLGELERVRIIQRKDMEHTKKQLLSEGRPRPDVAAGLLWWGQPA